jgi:dTDP-L-rhamnose 4-epimerase
MRILITGGAGFIGSHLADELLAHGHKVRAIDALAAQVHGTSAVRPAYLDPEVEFIRGDIRDLAVLGRALKGIDAIYHLAAEVGVGQSMYQIASYTSTNTFGTGVLLQQLIAHPVERLIVASSMSIYGEGSYQTPDGRDLGPCSRTLEQLRRGDWEVKDGKGGAAVPVATRENKVPALASVYALSKFDQEQLCLLMGEAYRIPTTALRFFNVYGTRQSLSNPYTGVLAIFASRLLNGNSPLIFEDGLQLRDFVSVKDVARACRLALEAPASAGMAINVASGRKTTVVDVAQSLARVLGTQIGPQVSGKYRVGDVRHCFADIGLARRVLGYEPRVEFDDGIEDLADWLAGQVADDRVIEAQADLTSRGLTV